MNGNIPVLMTEGENLPQAWERAVLAVWEKGAKIKTEYDRPTDPPSKDCTMVMVIHDPIQEPRIHRAIPAGLEALEVYRQEVINGVHDHWIDPSEGKWTYTYHQRLFRYVMEGEAIDQINYIISKLSQRGFSRRAQAITWNPALDPLTDDPPCLQRIFFRLLEDGQGRPVLNMNAHWRSRDAYKAAFMNIFALTELQRLIAQRISENTKGTILVGRYVDISDSFHIYGSYYDEFKNFLKVVRHRSFQDRTWTTEFARPYFEEAKRKLQQEARQNVEGKA